jgi:NADH:ubiquinone reductase (H+-translocating)
MRWFAPWLPLAHLLKDAIEWEYRQSVRHLRGWDPVAG